jgi:hypothetical protein
MFLMVLGDPIFSILAPTHLDRSDYNRHMMNAATFAAGAASDEAFVNFDWMLAPNAIPLWPDHAGPELMQNLESGFIASKTELALKLKRGLARGLGCHEITSPKPD